MSAPPPPPSSSSPPPPEGAPPEAPSGKRRSKGSKGSKGSIVGTKKSRSKGSIAAKSVTGKSTAGKSTAGKSAAALKRKSSPTASGKKRSGGSLGGKEKSSASVAGTRKSSPNSAGRKKKRSKGDQAKSEGGSETSGDQPPPGPSGPVPGQDLRLDPGRNFRGMYRTWQGVREYSALLPLVINEFKEFFPWPPRNSLFWSSGYYYDLDGSDGDLPENEIMIHNLPPGITEAEIKKEFPTAKKITINPDGTANIEFEKPVDATIAYNNSRLLKLGNRHLGWLRPDEVYLIGVPADIKEDHILVDFPGGSTVSFQTDFNGVPIATIKFPSKEAADQGYEEAPYKKIGNRQLVYEPIVNPVKVTNLPPGITEAEIRKAFPNAKSIEIDKGHGIAKVLFASDLDAARAYEDSDLLKLGKPHLGWLRPEELYIQEVPKGATEKGILKHFPTAKSVKFQNGPGGKRIATVIFPNEAEQKKAYEASDWKKMGPQKLLYGGDEGNNPDTMIELSNLPPGITEGDIKKKFPTATGIRINPDGTAVVEFANPDAATKAFNNSNLLKLGKNKLGWLRPEEFYIQDVPPNATEEGLLKQFPTAKAVKFQNGPGGKRIATVVFPNEATQKKAYNASHWKKPGPQKLIYGGEGGGKDSQLTISNIPPGVTEADLKKKFPNAIGVSLSPDGTAVVQFANPGAAKKAYEDSDLLKLGKNKLGWLRPEEFYVRDVPSKVTEADLKKQFPTATGVKFQNADGKKIATVIFPNETEQKKAYDASNWKKPGPQKLIYGGGGETSITISNLPPGITEGDLRKKFPGASSVKINPDGTAVVNFPSPDAAKKAFDGSDMLKIGKNKLGWLSPEELSVSNVPKSVTDGDIQKEFPKATKLKWINGDDGKRFAIVVFKTPEEQKSSYDASNYLKLGPQKLGYKGSGDNKSVGNTPSGSSGTGGPEVQDVDNIEGMSDDELAKKLWKLPNIGFSNISNLFTPAIVVSNLPPTITRTQLLKQFPEAQKIDIFGKGKGLYAQIEFDTPHKAAHAYGISKKFMIDGHHVTVHPKKIGGGGKRGGSRSVKSSKSSSTTGRKK